MIWSRPELRVLFVCTANICRSPLAEALLRHRLRVNGLGRRVQVRSAGTAAQRGLRPDLRAIEVAEEVAVPLRRIRSRRLTPKMLSLSDYVIVMDRSQLEEVREMAAALPNEYKDMPGRFAGKLELLGHFLPASAREVSSPDIPDPYFSDQQGFRDVHAMIDTAVHGLMEHIVESLDGGR